MANFANPDFIKKPAGTSPSQSVVVDRRSVTQSTAPAVNDTIELAVLPPRHVPVGLKIAVPDLDASGTPAISCSLGFLNPAKTALSTAATEGGAVLASGLTEARTGGYWSDATSGVFNILSQVQPVDYERYLAVAVTAAAATFASGTFRVVLETQPV